MVSQNRLICPLFLILALRTTLAEQLPIWFDYRGFPFVHANRDGTGRVPFRLAASSYSHEILWGVQETAYETDSDFAFCTLSGDTTSVSGIRVNVYIEQDLNDGIDQRILGMGHGSGLLQITGSTGMTRLPTPLLHLNISEEVFVQTWCANESNFSLSNSGPQRNVEIQIGNAVFDNALLQISPIDFILSVPHMCFDELLAVIEMIAPDWREGIVTTIPDCLSARARLPDVRVSFASIGTLVLSPEDYTILRYDGSCDLLIRDSHSNFMSFNPLLIPGVNVWFSHDHLMVCDAI